MRPNSSQVRLILWPPLPPGSTLSGRLIKTHCPQALVIFHIAQNHKTLEVSQA